MKHKIIFLFLLLSPVLIIVGICALAATSGPLNNSKLPELKQKDYPFSLSAKQLRKMLAPDAVKYDKVALYLCAMLKAQQERIAALEERLEVLENTTRQPSKDKELEL